MKAQLVLLLYSFISATAYGASSYIGIDGKEHAYAIQPQFKRAYPFSEGLAVVGVSQSADWREYKFGFINHVGQWVIQPQFDEASKFSGGLARVGFCGGYNKTNTNDISRDCKYGYIDKAGRFVINPQFDYAESFHLGLATVENKASDGSWLPSTYIDAS